MTQEDKELLLKDICARLPYKVKYCIYIFGENTARIKEDVHINSFILIKTIVL